MQTAIKIPTPQALVNDVLQLISLPQIYLRLQQIIDDPLHTRAQVGETVAVDPALSARVLRIANSSYYSFPRPIETVEMAVGIIGELDLRNLVLATTVVGSMNSIRYAGVNIDAFWHHSLQSGLLARQIARHCGGCEAELLFLGGVLHDIGILVMYQKDAELARAVDRQIEQQHQLRDQAERELLGFDHAEVGSLLADAWGLPANVGELLRCHHQYQLSKSHSKACQILSLASIMSDENEPLDPQNLQFQGLLASLEIGESPLAEIVEAAAAQFDEIRSLILS